MANRPKGTKIADQWMRVDFELRIISNNCDVLFDRLEMSLDNLTLLPCAEFFAILPSVSFSLFNRSFL